MRRGCQPRSGSFLVMASCVIAMAAIACGRPSSAQTAGPDALTGSTSIPLPRSFPGRESRSTVRRNQPAVRRAGRASAWSQCRDWVTGGRAATRQRRHRGAAPGGDPGGCVVAASTRRRHEPGCLVDSRPVDRTYRPGERAQAGRRTRPGHRSGPAAGEPGVRRPGARVCAVAAQPLYRANLVSGGRPGADGQRSGRERQPQLAVHRRARRDDGPRVCRGVARDRLRPFERHECGLSILGRDLRADRCTPPRGGRPRRCAGGDQRRDARRRRSVLRPPVPERPARHRA